MTTETTSHVAVKPLVLVVQSPHYSSVRQSDADTMLKELDDITYARSLFITRMAETLGMQGRTNIYLDGLFPDAHQQYNEFLQILADQNKSRGEGSRGSELAIPSQEWYAQTLLGYNPDRYRFSHKLRKAGREFFAGLEHIAASKGVDLIKFEEDRLLSMISYAVARGANIEFRPGEYDKELMTTWLVAEQRGDRTFRKTFYGTRDDNLYEHMEKDFQDGGVNSAIVYFGNDHEMRRLRATPYFDVFWAEFARGINDRVWLQATLPGGSDATSELHEAYRSMLGGDKARIVANINFRPREKQIAISHR